MNPDEATTPDPAAETGAESFEDYSYDLAHEVPAATRQQAENRSAPRPGEGGRAPQVDPDGDYSYDLAHEVPPQGS